MILRKGAAAKRKAGDKRLKRPIDRRVHQGLPGVLGVVEFDD